jgi:hypothetical protein
MDIGNPEREYIVEPVEDPVPREVPVPEPDRNAPEPEPVHPPGE